MKIAFSNFSRQVKTTLQQKERDERGKRQKDEAKKKKSFATKFSFAIVRRGGAQKVLK